ncbi:hypothetical protein FRC02_011737 [Tulasnella sp. 418]|nr:hypothetical protein FRC02_011737 [Tulasnella sp. 418]
MADTAVQTTGNAPSNAKNEPTETVESHVDQGKRAFALGQYEEAVSAYASALELLTEKYGDGAPESADVLFMYGKALLENAISQAGVLGKEEAENALKGEKEAMAGPSTSKAKGPVIHFSGDEPDDEPEQDEAVDLFANAAAQHETNDAEGEEEEAEGAEEEPEDDFNAAWEVLELARSLYAKQDSEEAKLKLADVYMALGDVSTETEKFDQAVNDYTSGLQLKLQLLPFYSRQVADAHYRLSMVLDLTPGRLSHAIEHAEKALQSVDARLEVLREALPNAPTTKPETPVVVNDPKGKKKATPANVDDVGSLRKDQIEVQIKEFEGLRVDLSTKVEDLKAAPEQPAATVSGESAQDAANRALDEVLNPGQSLAGSAGAVHDLSGMVKKKKKPAQSAQPSESTPVNGSGKRKAEDEMEDGSTTPVDKRVKLDEEMT